MCRFRRGLGCTALVALLLFLNCRRGGEVIPRIILSPTTYGYVRTHLASKKKSCSEVHLQDRHEATLERVLDYCTQHNNAIGTIGRGIYLLSADPQKQTPTPTPHIRRSRGLPYLTDTSPPPSPSGSSRTDKLFGTTNTNPDPPPSPPRLPSPPLKAARCWWITKLRLPFTSARPPTPWSRPEALPGSELRLGLGLGLELGLRLFCFCFWFWF